MWYELRRLQHRVYWRKQCGGRDYEAFPTEEQARLFIGLCKKFGRNEIVTRHRARTTGAAATMVTTVTTPGGPTVTIPALAAGLTAPSPAGITLAWLGEQYVASGNKANETTQGDYRRDLKRYIYPYFQQESAGDRTSP